MKKFILSMAIAMCAVNVMAQDTKEPGMHLADETWLYEMHTRTIKVVTSNRDIADQLINWYHPCQCMSYTYKWKKDRNGPYVEWAITLPMEKKDDIVRAYSHAKPRDDAKH